VRVIWPLTEEPAWTFTAAVAQENEPLWLVSHGGGGGGGGTMTVPVQLTESWLPFQVKPLNVAQLEGLLKERLPDWACTAGAKAARAMAIDAPAAALSHWLGREGCVLIVVIVFP
jgi:hypothetical protein